MSSKNVGKPSIEGDRYYSPPWTVRQCVEVVLPTIRSSPPKRIIEPSAGSGAFLEQLRPAFPSVNIVANDLDPTVGPWDDATVSMREDFLTWPRSSLDFDLCIGNPPFTLALEFVEKSLLIANQVVYLLRQGFLASEERREILRKSPLSDVFALAHRPSFTADGKTDSENYLFCCWTNGWTGPARFHLLPTVSLEERKVLAKGLKGYEPRAVVPRLHHDKLFGDDIDCSGCGYPPAHCECEPLMI